MEDKEICMLGIEEIDIEETVKNYMKVVVSTTLLLWSMVIAILLMFRWILSMFSIDTMYGMKLNLSSINNASWNLVGSGYMIIFIEMIVKPAIEARMKRMFYIAKNALKWNIE
jgi:hypothetical protein